MAILADTHVHIYPCYDLSAFFNHAFKNFAALGSGPDDKNILFLTERFDCDYFSGLAGGKFNNQLPGLSIEASSNPHVIIVRDFEGNSVHLVAGRQIITAERIEVLALNCLSRIADGRPASQTLRQVTGAGGTPVLPWAPGKWFFARKKVIAELIDESDPGRVLLADSSLRPPGWPTPGLTRKATRLGFRVIAGSDPLPFRGEEKRVATYCVKSNHNFPAEPASFLFDPKLVQVGSRSSVFEVIGRLYRNEKVRKR